MVISNWSYVACPDWRQAHWLPILPASCLWLVFTENWLLDALYPVHEEYAFNGGQADWRICVKCRSIAFTVLWGYHNWRACHLGLPILNNCIRDRWTLRIWPLGTTVTTSIPSLQGVPLEAGVSTLRRIILDHSNLLGINLCYCDQASKSSRCRRFLDDRKGHGEIKLVRQPIQQCSFSTHSLFECHPFLLLQKTTETTRLLLLAKGSCTFSFEPSHLVVPVKPYLRHTSQ